MIHRLVWRVSADAALDFWQTRLAGESIESRRDEHGLVFSDPEGLAHELVVVETGDEPLVAIHPEIPAELALQGLEGVRAFAVDPEASRPLLETALGFVPGENGLSWEVRGENRGGSYAYDAPPVDRSIPGAGTVHHVAWSSTMEDHERWRDRLAASGAQPTPIIDRFWFRSIYFREPSGVLFEIATLGPGFTTDEPLEHLGESLVLPPAFESLRSQVEQILTPIPNLRAAR
jgi:glyoxalase family protein